MLKNYNKRIFSIKSVNVCNISINSGNSGGKPLE